MLIRTDQVAGIRGKLENSLSLNQALKIVSLLYVLVEREILEKFDHPFIMGLEFAF